MMKLIIARCLFLACALGVTAMAAVAWHVPSPRILDTQYCAQPQLLRGKSLAPVRPDSDLLLFLVGMQSRR